MKNLNLHFHKNITLEQAVCGGNFFIQLKKGKTVKVLLKPGIRNGHKIRLKNFGLVSDDGRDKGDALITLNVMEHPLFKLNGLDISTDFVISPVEAATGIVKKISGPDGKKIALRIAPKSMDGDVITVKGAGLSLNGDAGDLHFHLIIENLESLNDLFNSTMYNSKKQLLN